MSPISFLRNHTISPFPPCSIEFSWKLRAWPAPNDTRARKVRFFTLQPVIVVDGIRIGKQWVGGEEGGVQRDHRGCERRRTAVKATVQLRPETPGKHSRGISGTLECFVLIHILLWSSGQQCIKSINCVINIFWFYCILQLSIDRIISYTVIL